MAVVLSQTIELRVPKDLYVNVWSKKEKPVETVEGPGNCVPVELVAEEADSRQRKRTQRRS